jgi:uncharacterized protein YcbK (DUF882 family)
MDLIARATARILSEARSWQNGVTPVAHSVTPAYNQISREPTFPPVVRGRAGSRGARACSASSSPRLGQREPRLELQFSAGAYVSSALRSINHLLRDFRSGEERDIDADLLDLLHGLSSVTRTRQPFEVISGYRSPATNQMLRNRNEGVAAHSLHMVGRAIDVRLADVHLRALHQAALSMRRGGVGYYPASNFVHVDTGRQTTNQKVAGRALQVGRHGPEADSARLRMVRCCSRAIVPGPISSRTI